LFEMAKDYFESEGHTVLGGYFSPVSDGYGKKGLLPSTMRLEMCNMAVESSDWLMVDGWEASFPTWTLTYQSLEHFTLELNKAYSIEKNDKIKIKTVLVCGSDLLQSFSTPNLWSPDDIKAILKTHGIACVSRQGSSPEDIVWDNDLLYPLRGHIHMLRQYIPNDISSTRIRQALKRDMSIKYLLPDNVVEYIKKHKLYREKNKDTV